MLIVMLNGLEADYEINRRIGNRNGRAGSLQESQVAVTVGLLGMSHDITGDVNADNSVGYLAENC
jgi:hypothetical protein